MNNEELNRWKLTFAFIASVFLIYGGYFLITRELYFTLQDLFSNAKIVEINVYALWVPVGALGVLLFIASAFPVAFITRKKADQVWGDKGQRVFVWGTGIFAFLGLVFAIVTYQWLTSELEANGYTYSEEQSRLTAMGKHEVYIKP